MMMMMMVPLFPTLPAFGLLGLFATTSVTTVLFSPPPLITQALSNPPSVVIRTRLHGLGWMVSADTCLYQKYPHAIRSPSIFPLVSTWRRLEKGLSPPGYRCIVGLESLSYNKPAGYAMRENCSPLPITVLDLRRCCSWFILSCAYFVFPCTLCSEATSMCFVSAHRGGS